MKNQSKKGETEKKGEQRLDSKMLELNPTI